MYTFLLAFLNIPAIFGCGGGGGGPASITFAGGKGQNPFRNPHWSVDSATLLQWSRWHSQWLESQKELLEEDKKKVAEGWTDYDHFYKPRRWTRLPPGRDADSPPPWAIMPNMYGKPDFCFQPPNRGHCGALMQRWGFNAFINKCQQFDYSGCGGNSNNFFSERRCKEACLNLASTLCLKYGYRRDGVRLIGEPTEC